MSGQNILAAGNLLELLKSWASWTTVSLAIACCLLGLTGCQNRSTAEATSTTGKTPNPELEQGVHTSSPMSQLPQTYPADVFEPPSPQRPVAPEDWFEDVTSASGIDFAYQTGWKSGQYAMVESMGGGVGLFDFDNDGDIDIFFAGGGTVSAGQIPSGRPGALFRNDGDFRFSNVTAAVGLDQAGDYSHGVALGDYDRDGWTDLLVTCYGKCQLWRNREGQRFENQTSTSGLEIPGWHTAASFLDFNRDGWLDLFLCNYVDWRPGMFNPIGTASQPGRDVSMPGKVDSFPCYLLSGGPSGQFSDVSAAAGIRLDAKGLGVVAADFNRDGWIDVYVANDVVANYLYWGGPHFPWKEGALAAGVIGSEFGIPEGSMGVDAGDYDGDGWIDLFVTNYELEDNSLFHNERGSLFTHRSTAAGLAGRCRPFVGFATEFVDFDLDGWLDLYILNGHVTYHVRKGPYRQPPVLYRNHSGQRFEDVSAQGGPYFSVTHVGRGAAYGDLDNDGDLDLVLVHQNDPVVVLRNRNNPPAWLGLLLEGTTSNREAIGAEVHVQHEGRQLTRVVRGGGSYFSNSDRRVFLPCSSSEADIELIWPNGKAERFSGLKARQIHRVQEGTGVPVPQHDRGT